ncbi:hypothetical protein CHS0354_040894 [Potamilus streckersoni]|uniref:Uncharacterized protein n=1 Tax=Potamilus streckersoni TaxID=2493646 RepID=A0AAE0VYX6_9BIVA|nr:hypothetical protein CHS0354_040894 [Potamilus streckersoni]
MFLARFTVTFKTNLKLLEANKRHKRKNKLKESRLLAEDCLIPKKENSSGKVEIQGYLAALGTQVS